MFSDAFANLAKSFSNLGKPKDLLEQLEIWENELTKEILNQNYINRGKSQRKLINVTKAKYNIIKAKSLNEVSK